MTPLIETIRKLEFPKAIETDSLLSDPDTFPEKIYFSESIDAFKAQLDNLLNTPMPGADDFQAGVKACYVALKEAGRPHAANICLRVKR